MAYQDIGVETQGHVAVVEIRRPPNNFFDEDLMRSLADAFEELDRDANIRVLLLAAQGKHFCAGMNFGDAEARARRAARDESEGNPLYSEAVRLFDCKKPVVAAIQGAAVGGGFGLAVMADFRVVCPQTRFTANFVKLGYHPGFGLTFTLPRVIGHQKTNLMFLTGRRVDGETAYGWGLADVLTDQESLRDRAMELAQEIAENAPLALVSVRATMREGMAQAVKEHTDVEHHEQFRLRQTEDHQEGVQAVAERRPGNFKGR